MKINNFIDKFKKATWMLTPFLLITIIFMLLFRCYYFDCFDCNELQKKIDDIEQKIRDKDCLDCDDDKNIEENDTLLIDE